MSPLQRALYWREWGRAVSTCEQEGWPAPDRHALHVQALGCDKSSKSLTNGDLDRVLAAFRAVSRPDDLAAQLRQLRITLGARACSRMSQDAAAS